MLLERVLRFYPAFGEALFLKASKEKKVKLLNEIQNDYLNEMSECEELGSSDVSAYTFSFCREAIYALGMRDEFEAQVVNGRYEIVKL